MVGADQLGEPDGRICAMSGEYSERLSVFLIKFHRYNMSIRNYLFAVSHDKTSTVVGDSISLAIGLTGRVGGSNAYNTGANPIDRIGQAITISGLPDWAQYQGTDKCDERRCRSSWV